MREGDTIVALSSGSLPSGVAVVRISGPATRSVLESMIGDIPPARQLVLRDVMHDDVVLDRGLIAFFPNPHSFTGEDCAELQLHGSSAVVRAVLRAITIHNDVRLAEAGEFTRRAFEGGKLDLTEVEGLGDLIIAETESQRRQALARMAGGLSEKLTGWRADLLDLRAEIEARLDFSDEGDVADELPRDWFLKLKELDQALKAAIGDVSRGRIVREGFRVALAGLPNAGKSSLLNALSKSDLAIVSDEAGTTRDVREVPLDIDGQLVIFLDMAGLRDADSKAEAEGVRRAEAEIAEADLVLWLMAPDCADNEFTSQTAAPVWRIATKSDLGGSRLDYDYAVSALERSGLEQLLSVIATTVRDSTMSGETVLVSRERDRQALVVAMEQLAQAQVHLDAPEIAAESLRQASDALARLVGTLDSEQILDRLFSSFCIGK